MATYNAAQLYGTGSIIDFEIDSSTTFRMNKSGEDHGNNHVYLTFDIINGSSTAVPGLGASNFTLIDAAGRSMHVAKSNTNWAYSFKGGTHDTIDVTIADDLPTISENTLRVRALGLKRGSGETCLTISSAGSGMSMPVAMPVALASAPS